MVCQHSELATDTRRRISVLAFMCRQHSGWRNKLRDEKGVFCQLGLLSCSLRSWPSFLQPRQHLMPDVHLMFVKSPSRGLDIAEE